MSESDDNFVIDMHGHIGDYGNFFMPDVSMERLFAVYDICKVKCCIVSHVVGLYSHDFAYGNRATVEYVDAYPGKVFGYAVYDPHYPEESLADVKQYVARKGFVGVKIYPSGHAYSLDGPDYDPLWRLASDRGFPVLTHTWDPNPKATVPFDWNSVFAQPELLDPVAQKYPDVRVIMAHTGGHYDGHKQAIAMANKHANLYVDICGEPIDYGFLEWLVAEMSVEKIMYGSDQNWIEPRAMLGRVLGASISVEDKERILFRNAERFFGDSLRA